MHTSRDDYLINTLRFISAKEETQVYGAILPESLTSLEMKETQAYKTYLGFATGATPPKKARKFKKPASPKLTTVLVSTEESTGKSKRVKRPAKKSTKAPSRGVVIRETTKIPLSKKKEKEEYEGFSQDSSKWFWYCYQNCSKCCQDKPSVTNEGIGIKPGVFNITEEESSESRVESLGNDKDGSNNEQDSSGEDNDQENDSDDDKTQSDNENKSDSKHKTDESESDSESNQEKNKEDEEEVKDEFVKTPSNDSDDEDETKITHKAEVDTDKGFVQEEGINAIMTNVQQGNESPKILQVIEDAHVTLSTLPQKTEVPQTPTLLTVPISVIFDFSPVFSTISPQSLPSFTPSPQQSTSTPPPTTKAINLPSTLPNFASVFQFNNRVTALETKVFELKKDPFHTQWYQNPKDITDPTTAMNMALPLMDKAFKPNYSTPTNNNQRISSNPRNRQIAQPGMNMGRDRQMQMVGSNGEHQFRQYARQNVWNLNGYNAVQNVENQTRLLIAQKEEAGIQLQAEEFDLMAAAADLDEIEEVNANCILMANLQQASTSDTQSDKAPVYDSDGSAE
nr:Gag-Pol polyprotein [Tanacetum cinerariifolium]